MTLYFIGLGLNDEKDISLKGLEAIKKCKSVYLESYTSLLQVKIENLEKLYKKKIIIADRTLVENQAEETILKHAKTENTAFLVIGDPMCATTHIDLILRAKKENIKTEIIHNASIVSAIGITGLEVYKFGKITSIPFNNENVKAPIEVYKKNKTHDLHTLFLLDLDPINKKFLTIKQATEYLIKQGIKETKKAIACARIGSKDQKIVYTQLEKLRKIDFKQPPYCLIIPGKLHFMEEEALEQWQMN